MSMRILIKRCLYCIGLGMLLLSCPVDVQDTNHDTIQILSPVSSWTYFEDVPVSFSLNAAVSETRWTSSIVGELGVGNGFSLSLSAGTHVIEATNSYGTRSVTITVQSKEYVSSDEVSVMLSRASIERSLPGFDWYPYVIAGAEQVEDLQVSFAEGMNTSNSRRIPVSPAVMRDIAPARINRHAGVYTASGLGRSLLMDKIGALGDTREFLVYNTSNQYADPHIINATMVYKGTGVTVWYPCELAKDESMIVEFCSALEALVIPRVKALWGAPGDVNGDGAVSILLTDTINEEQVALGFFNPLDFFALDIDPASSSYNPVSNEMDMIYLAVPTQETTYSMETILATAAHELTHLVSFSSKTWNKMMAGSLDAPQEELFLDEGWSHLSESLCGYGISGGNAAFLNVYFEDTASYSLCGPSLHGHEDSAGRRGAMALFLSWLFWEKGGMEWNAEGNPVDGGGIAFLREMLDCNVTGWDSIGYAYGISTNRLFELFVKELNEARLANELFVSHIDPVTDEPVELYANMGSLSFGGRTITVSFPLSHELSSAKSLYVAPWTFAFYSPMYGMAGQTLEIQMEDSVPSAFLKILLD